MQVSNQFMRDNGIDGKNAFRAIFIIVFAAWAVAQSLQFGPSAGKGYAAALRIFSVIDEASDINVEDTHEQQVIASEQSLQGEIEFRNVWFRYPTRPEAWVLKNFSLKINANERVALVGESGSGKSTVVQLLYRFYEPHFGDIFIDGVNVKDYNLASLRRQLGLVQQEPLLFNESVLYNICYGEDGVDTEAAIEAAEISNALPFIAKLSDSAVSNKVVEEHEEDEDNFTHEEVLVGLEQSCGSKGGRLSGGQKQRIAIARAVIRKPKVLLLDEATSALDEVSQAKVQDALEKVMQGRTSVIIAHRLTTIENADRVVILKNGRMFKEGTFDQVKDDL